MQKKILMLLDGNSLINRAYYALSGRQNLTAPDGTSVAAVFAFLNMFLKYQKQINPDYIIAAFDRKEATFRHLKYDDYKGTRKGMPDDLAIQLPMVKDALEKIGVGCIEMAGFEADDLIGTYAKMAEAENFTVYIVSGDKDNFQLVDQEIKVVLPVSKMGKSGQEIYDEAAVFERYQLLPSQLIDLKAIMGDSSDNIPGVKGIGEKGAIELLKAHQNLDNLYEHLQDLKPAQQKKLIESKEMAYLSKDLGTIKLDVPVEKQLADFEYSGIPDKQALSTLFSSLNFKSMLAKFDVPEVLAAPAEPELSTAAEADLPVACAQLTTFIEHLKRETESVLSFLMGAAEASIFCLKGYCYLPKNDEEITALWQALSEHQGLILTWQYKESLRIFNLEPLPAKVYDLAVLAYLLQDTSQKINLQAIYFAYFQKDFQHQAEVQQLSLGLFSESLTAENAEATNSQKERVSKLQAIYEKQAQEIKDRQQEKLAYEIELPLTSTLALMEKQGVLIDQLKLNELGAYFQNEIQELSEAIYQYCDVPINLNSPKQMSELLFGKLDLKPGKKRQGGQFSTANEELERLKDQHPIIPFIMKHRHFSKLYQSFIEGLRKEIAADGRIHSTFNQMVTTTGRLSSSNPNLQNIPVRTVEGNKIRELFIASPGHIFLDADYSQIELRLLAHLSNDENMLEAFKKNEDIHRATACYLFNCGPEAVTGEQRSIAKTVNFSIVYGISDFGLARDLGVSIKEAHHLITEYHRHYPNIQKYLETQIKHAYDYGYVETLLHRRRYLHELQNKNKNIRQFGERAAMNAPVQGSAADLIKMAMLQVEKDFQQHQLEANLILQIHDELIVEVKVEDAAKAAELLQQAMEGAMQLQVPLLAEVHQGRSWLEAK